MKLYMICHNQNPYIWEPFRAQLHKDFSFLMPLVFTSETSAQDFILDFIYKVFNGHKANVRFAAEMKQFEDLLKEELFSSKILSNPLIKTLLFYEIKIVEIESDQFV